MHLQNPVMENPKNLFQAFALLSAYERLEIVPGVDAWGRTSIVKPQNGYSVNSLSLSGANHCVDVAALIGLVYLHNLDVDMKRLEFLSWMNNKKTTFSG